MVTAGLCVAVWWPASTLGAWGQLFFEQKLTVRAAATAALLIVLFRRHGEQNRKRRAAALMLPSVWLLLALTVSGTSEPPGCTPAAPGPVSGR